MSLDVTFRLLEVVRCGVEGLEGKGTGLLMNAAGGEYVPASEEAKREATGVAESVC